jgi:hypothetical protein
MIGQLQQILACGLLLLFGVLALRVWRRAGPVRRDLVTQAWGVTAAYFLVNNVYSVGHSLLAALGLAMGRDSALLRWVGGWAIAANLARGVMGVVFAVILLLLLVLRRRWVFRVAQLAPLVLVVTGIAATAVAQRIPVLHSMYWLGAGLALLSMATAVVMMGALLAAVLNDGMDQLLWLALALYALKETVSVSLFAIIAWWSLAAHPEAWRYFYWGAAALAAGMSALAARRLRLAGEGRHVPALFERLYTLRRSPVP